MLPPWWRFALVTGVVLTACAEAPGPDVAYRAVPQGDPERGAMLLTRYQCGRCHAVPGAPSDSITIASPLEAFGARSYIAGRVPNGPATLQRWLQDPQSVVAGTAMPNVGMSPDDARDMAAYLLSLR